MRGADHTVEATIQLHVNVLDVRTAASHGLLLCKIVQRRCCTPGKVKTRKRCSRTVEPQGAWAAAKGALIDLSVRAGADHDPKMKDADGGDPRGGHISVVKEVETRGGCFNILFRQVALRRLQPGVPLL